MGMDNVDQKLALIHKKLDIYLKPEIESIKQRKVPTNVNINTIDDLVSLFNEITDICVSQLLDGQMNAASFMISDLRNLAKEYL